MKAYAIGLYEKAMPDTLSWEEMLICSRECGYDFLELSIDESAPRLARLDWTDQQRLELIQAMFRTGMPVRSMCLSGHRKFPLGARDPEIRQQGLRIMEKAIALADDLGIRIIQLAGYDAYYEEHQWDGSKEAFAENLIRCAQMAAAKGIAMGFETMETSFMNTVWKSMRYVSRTDSPWLGIYPDCGNLNNAALEDRASLTGDLASGHGHILAMHLKPTKPGLYRNMLFDSRDNRVDFRAAIAAAWKLGVRRYVTELWYLGGDDWRENITTANRTMCALLDCCAETEQAVISANMI